MVLHKKLSKLIAEKLAHINDMEDEEGKAELLELTNGLMGAHELNLKPNWINFLISASVGFEAIPIGYVLVIGPIFILQRFEGLDSTVVGILYGSGTALATVICML